MSRTINTSLATIQFQVNARQASAAMQALQNMSNDLNSSIDKVKKNIENLGKNVPADNPQLLNYQSQLAGLKKDLKDVEKAQRDFLKGAKAADQLWQAATNGNIESLSFRSIKAGINGLKKRQEGLSPGDAQDMKDWRIIKEVIDEADRVVKQAGADVQNVVQTIREGGKVSEQTMRQTINTLKELKGSVDETDAEYRTYGNDLDFMEAKLKEFNEAQRRARGEIVDANDARREMNKLTEEGAAAAKREAEEADQLVASLKQESEELVRKRGEIKQNIEDTQKQIDENHKLIEEKHRQLAADEETFNAEQQGRRETIDGLKQQAEAERKLANEKSDAAETHRRAADLQKQTTEQLNEKVTELQGKLEALNAEPVKPKVDSSEIDALNEKLRLAEELFQQKTTAANTAFNNYVSAKGLTPISKRDNVAFRENFEKMYGLAGYMDISHMDAKRNLRFPLDMRLDQVKDAAGAREEDWEVNKEQAQKILDDYNWFVEKIDKVAEAIAAQYKKLSQASSEGVDPEQLKTVAANIKRLEDLRAQFLKASEDMAMDGVNRPQEMFGDVDKTIDNVGRNVDRAIKKAIDERYEFHEKKHAVEIQEAKEASELANKEKEAAQIAVDGIKKEIETKKQNVGATKSEAEAVKELIKMRERINELHQKKDSMSGIMPTAGIDKELNELMPKYEAGMKGLSEESRKLVREFTEAKRDLADIIKDEKEADETLKQFGITTADVADDLKLQAAAEKALKIEEESRLELAKQMLEVRKQIGAESLKDSRIVGSKKEQDFYKKNKDILEDEYWKGEAGGGSVGRMYKYLNDIADDSEAKAEFQEQVGVSVKDAMRVAAQRMREVLQEAMKRGIKVDDALSSFEDGYGQGPATKIYEFFKEFNEEIGNKEDELIRKRRRKLDAILDVVEDPGDETEMPSREERLKLAKSALKGVGEGYYGNDTPLAESRRQQEEEVTRLDAKVKEYINTQEQSNEKSEEELRLKGELETAQGKLAESEKRENEEQQKYVKLQGEAIEQGNKAAEAETKLADAQSEATQKQADFNQKQQEGLDNINQMAQGNQALQQSIDGLNGELEQNSKDYADNAAKTAEAEQKKAQARQLSIKRMEEMLAKLKEEYYTEELTAEKREEHIKQIQQLEKAISTEKAKPALQMMTERMDNLGALSASALEETKRFWDAMVQGAEKGSEKLAAAEANVKKLVEEERKRKAANAEDVITNASANGIGDVRQAVQEAERLRDSMSKNREEWEHYNDLVKHGKEYIDEWAKADAYENAVAQMQNLTKLTDSGLADARKYWEAMRDGADSTAEQIAEAKNNIKALTEQEQQRLQNRTESILLGGGYKNSSEREVIEAIKNGKQLIETYGVGRGKAIELGEAIAKAEAYLKEWGLEASRAKVKQAELDDRMRNQFRYMVEDMNRGVMPSQSVVKAQMNYWKKMAEDPKTASTAVQKYLDQLKEVENMQDAMVKINGETAFEWFQNGSYKDASTNKVKEMAADLKAYRDTLPQETEAAKIQQIDQWLQKTGQSAKKATEELMDFEKAKELALQAGDDVYGKNNPAFLASPEEIQAATKSIENYRENLFKTIKAKKDMGEATDEEEAELKELAKYLKDLKFEQDNFNMSREKMEALMANPVNATSLDELRAAIKRADAELKRMEGSLGKNNAQYKAFAEQVRNAKNTLKEMEGTAKASATAWEKAWSRLKTYVVMYMGFNAVWQKMVGTADDLMQLSDKMGEVRKTTGFTADEVGRLSDNLAKLDTRTNLTGLMEFSSLAGSIGLKTQEAVQGFTEAANMIAVSLPEMGNEASRTLMKIADATGDLEKNGGNVRETLERVGSTIIALRANSAAAAGPITDFVSRVGAVGAQAGISIDQIAALGATVDALGGRVEMSATALSRMIPAIKNNSFAVAQAIGMTEKELKGKTGMEQMVAIFRALHDSVKGFDTSTEEGMNAMADSVEKALGRSTSMQDVMKQLNQQGARAGIVFGLLSQNVDKLEEQLVTAGKAYEKNTALMDEYNKMNDTAAAKWERLKNQLEEFFVSAENSSWLGDIIDSLRVLVDFLTEEGPIGRFFRWSLVYLALWKAKWAEAIGTALISVGQFFIATKQSTAATVADTAAKTANAAATEATAVANEHAAVASGKFNKTMKANLVALVATAVVALGWALYDYAKKAKKAAQQMDVMADVEKKAREESVKERVELEKLYKVTQDQTASMEERKKALHDMVGDAKYKEYYSKLSTESELASAAASAYKELSEQILATARARALDAKAEELQRRRIGLEYQKKDREDWEEANREKYRAGKRKYKRQQEYVGSVTGGATAGFQESQIAQQGAAAMKPAIIDEFENSVKERKRIDGEIEQIDKDIDKLKQQVSELNIKTDTGNGGNGGGGGDNNPYGDYDRVKSDYNDWDANALVARRKEMLERVRALANGADVQAVLSEDAKFISDAVRKNIKTTSDAIEWYNTERLKIQEALHAKHLTNTGDWMDPKQQKIRKKLMQDDMKAYLEELDAYYTERKTEIDRARNDEEISEAEAWNRNIKNEAEWHKRRAELQIMYSNKHKQIAEDEQDAISAIVAERTGDDAKYIKATIVNTRKFSEAVKAMNDQGAKEYRKFQGDLDLGSEKDWNKVEKALKQHLKAIEDIVNKERPFNGIAKNMQDNLGKMGILTADLAEGADSAAEELKRITFLLGEAENAYTMTVDKLLDDMRQNGFREWADVISKDPSMQQGLLSMLRQTFDAVQDAIKKESSIIKKQVEIMMQDITEQVQADTTRLQILQNSVSRANSLIGAGPASERVADKLAMKQMQLQITMQETRIRMLKKAGADRVALLQQEADLLDKQGKKEEAKQKRMDAENVEKSVGLTLTKEQVELDKQRISLAEKLEESQNRLYTELKEWGDLLASSMREVMEASNAGNAEYYNELAKYNLTGKGGPGAGTYIVIENEGKEDAEAHYEYLSEREALDRQHEIEQENAQAEAWRKVMDDLNAKMNEQITDWMNAALQNQSIDANTSAVNLNNIALNTNTQAMAGLTGQLAQGITIRKDTGDTTNDHGLSGLTDNSQQSVMFNEGVTPGVTWTLTDDQLDAEQAQLEKRVNMQLEGAEKVRQANEAAFHKVMKTEGDSDKQMVKSTQSTFAKMTLAANMYGVAYQAMSNENLSTTQKFEMMALQAVGNYAISALTTEMAAAEAKAATDSPGVFGKLWKELGWAATPVFALFTGLLGGLMGLATSKIGKAKSTIAQATGASASASAGKLATGMLAYAEGNVNEFTDPGSLKEGRQYNVDAADGRTYRARYMGKGAKTHITNGPEFHLVGEKGREAIIDAGTTRQITLNEPEIWHSIQTLYNGGSLRHSTLRRGVRAFADGNLEEFEMADGGGMMADSGFTPEMAMQMQAALDRNSAVMETIVQKGIKAYFDVYGKGGLVDSYDTGKKTVNRHGERY